MKRFYYTLLLLFVSFVAHSQTATIEVLGRLKGDSVALRWAPSTAVAWQLGNKYGYNVYRYAIRSSEDSLYSEGDLIASGVKPIAYDDWEPLVKKDKYAAIAAQALYGETFVVSNPGANTMDFVNQVNEQESRFGFSLYAADLSPVVAEAMGLRFLDKLPDDEIRWVYRVELAGNPTEYKVSGGSEIIDPDEQYALPPPSDVKAEFHDHRVRLSWVSLYDYGKYIAYIIERSEDGGITYKKRSEVPVAVVSKNNIHRRRTYFFDSLEVNYKAYHYRVKGISPFGETGPPSEAVFGAGLGSAAGTMASIDSAAVTERSEGYIHWTYPEHKKQNLIGFKVGRAPQAKGPFIEISQVLNTTEYIDPFPEPVNYYVVKAIGRDSIATQSMPVLVQLLDSIPPTTPSGLKGMIDSTGMVHLDWKPNKERDIAGYRIFRGNSLNEEFVQITVAPVQFSDYIDEISLETLTEQIYYKIIAIDHHDNSSEYSPPVKLQKPDKIPPVAPVFKLWRSDEKGIYLEWINSTSKDVTAHKLFKKDEKGNQIELGLQPGQIFFADQEGKPGRTYGYFIQAVDDAGLLTNSTILEIQAFDNGIRPVIAGFKGRADREARRINLAWKYSQPDVSRYLIYRKKGNEPMRLMKAVGGDQQVFSDYNVAVNNLYTYRIKAVFQNDDETKLSEEVLVEY